MPNKIQEVSLSELPDSLIRRISEILHKFSTPLIKEIGNDVKLIGSGTFVSLTGIYGILTARHVTDELTEDSSIGLVLQEGMEEKNVIPVEELRIIGWGKAPYKSEGPDLSFIKIPLIKVGTIKAHKSFFNLDKDCDEMLTNPLPLDSAPWFICGNPEEELTNENAEVLGNGPILVIQGYCSLTGADREINRGKYDYIEIGAQYDGISNPPKSFKGFSGGGLWQVPLISRKKGVFEPKNYLLSGVAFYQSPLVGGLRSVTCHGRKSVYKVVHNTLVNLDK